MASRFPAGPPGDDLIPRIPYPMIAILESVPDGVREDMRTIDPISLSADERGAAAMEMVHRSVPVVQEIERAAQDLSNPATTATCLAFVEARNELTGAWGLLACRWFADGSLSRPLAELLVSEADWTDETPEAGRMLGRAAKDGELLLVAYKDREDGPERGVFACVGRKTDGEHIAWTFLARLLVTPFEIAQWSDPNADPTGPVSH